jgi:NADPH2:quinone reductase
LALSATGVDPRTAAAFGWVTPTAYDLVNTVGRVRADDSVLVHAAAGGVGSLIAQFLTAVDARRVVGVVGNAEQVDYAQQLGYHRVLAADAFPDDLGDETFDVIFDPIGGAARTANLARLAPHGRLVVYGNIASFEAIAISINDLLANGQSLVTYNSNLASQTNPQRLAASAAQALALVADGSVRIGITAEYPLADVGQAVANLATGSTLGKSIIRVR